MPQSMPQSMCPMVPCLSVLHLDHCESFQTVSDLLEDLHLLPQLLSLHNVLPVGGQGLKVPHSLGHHHLLQLPVHDVEPNAITNPLNLSQAVTNHLDDVHLLHQELLLDEVSKVDVPLLCGHSLQVLQGSGHLLLQLQHCSHGLQGSAPLHPGGLGDVLQHHLAPALGLVLHKGTPMPVHCIGGL